MSVALAPLREHAIRHVTVEIRGGLGNQLFQYAVGRSLSRRHGVPLLLDLSWIKTEGPMAFCLDDIVDRYRVADATHIPLKAKTAGSRYKKAKRAFEDALRHRAGIAAKRLDERPRQFNAEVFDYRPSLYLSGYWQSERYFSDCVDDIRQSIRLPMPADQSTASAIDDAGASAVSMHIRRGDYVGSHTHPCCAPEYYQRAAAHVASLLDKPPVFFIFSDDLPWVRENIHLDYEMVAVDEAGQHRNYEDMALMTRCKSHVIANSSFSWWGAWLNPDPGKIVVAPETWFGGVPTRSLPILPERWTILSSESPNINLAHRATL